MKISIFIEKKLHLQVFVSKENLTEMRERSCSGMQALLMIRNIPTKACVENRMTSG
jgi:hypothetical protein